jgi:cellulose synthase/poly-beta-1,6-N-acetylglucosamine synthase-like glycosyltransferase
VSAGTGQDGVEVSVVIPVFNEEGMIGETITSALESIGAAGVRGEVIVVDHGSTDRSGEIATAHGATVLSAADAPTISALRNRGVGVAQGEFVVFLDADTSLTAEWARHIGGTLESLGEDPLQLCGSVREAPSDGSLLSRAWYSGLSTETEPSHLGGGHIITTKEAIRLIGGFDESLETGEDYEFCVRAKTKGVSIRANPALRATHRGVPGTLAEFLRREVWHGRGDLLSLSAVLGSRVAMASLLFAGVHLIALLAVLALLVNPGSKAPLVVLGSCLILATGLCGAASLTKYRDRGLRIILINAALFYAYFGARAFSFVSVARRREPVRRMRSQTGA